MLRRNALPLWGYFPISGYNDGTFRPGNPVTRAQLAKIIVLSQGWALYSPPAPTFTDVPASHAFYPYIETAYSHNVMEGFCDGTFRPDNPVSRAELARYLYAAVTQPGWPTHRAPTLLSTCIPLLTATPTPTGTVTATGATSTSTPSGVPASTITATPSIPAPTTTNTPTGTPTLIPMTVSDVHPSDYFYEAVRMLYGRGIISGYADNIFRPYNNTTRGQLSKIIVLAKGWSVYNPITATFRDVPMGSPFFAYVETAYAHQVISGYGCGDGCLEFRPGNSITRGQLCKIVVLAQEWPLYDPPSPTFIDVPPADPFFRYVETAYSRGIISGYDCGPGCLEFRPGNNAIRGQICKIVYGASN
ncbi:MAG: S-layer homology domain-containing protein [Chloroflexia bacterium]